MFEMIDKHRDVSREASFHKNELKKIGRKKRGEIDVEEIEHKQKEMILMQWRML